VLYKQKERIILGIDPGTAIMGYGVIKILNDKPFVIKMGIFKLKKCENHYIRLHNIFNKVIELIDEFSPNEFAIESPFLKKNVQSMLKLGRAQGAAMIAALFRNIPIYEYAPLKIKMSITGNGQASKEQVANMLHHYLIISKKDTYQLDATDGLATALCHFFQKKIIQN
jgi:crossover junction endodeoxyribonuclease RuvC